MVSDPLRALEERLAATESVAVPVPEPALAATVIHPAPLTAVHEHPVPVLTARLLVPPEAARDTAVVDRAYEQGDVNVNGLEGLLWPVPPGPTATTRASSIVPGVSGHAGSVVARSTRMSPLLPGAGFPRVLV
jgi:hypothetical protein